MHSLFVFTLLIIQIILSVLLVQLPVEQVLEVHINQCTEKQILQGITQGQYWGLSTWTEKNRVEVQRWRVGGGDFSEHDS